MKNDDAFAAALTEQLARRSMRQTDLAAANGVTRAYISKLTNSAAPSPQWVDILADTMKVSDEERRALHRAAADRMVKNMGYKV